MYQSKVGLIINPIAGMGGSVGLKGSDGKLILKQARDLGAVAHSPDRAKDFLNELYNLKQDLTIYTLEGIMGGKVAKECGFSTEFIHNSELQENTKLFETSPSDTILAAKILKEKNVSIIIFIGGDGTARDIYKALGNEYPCLGVPAGVKIHSSVFATIPEAAAKIVSKYFKGDAPLRESEVLDIDEDAFRDNQVISKLYGYLKTPYVPTLSQPSKVASPHTVFEQDNQERIAAYIIDQWDKNFEDWHYLIGPGTTTRAIAKLLNEKKTLLGVDLFYQKKLIAQDLNEEQMLKKIEGKNVKLIVTPIGAQGFIFGRGNLQLSAKVLETIGLKNIIIIATKFKLSTLPNGKLRCDSRNREFDRKFSGLHRIIQDYGELIIAEVI